MNPNHQLHAQTPKDPKTGHSGHISRGQSNNRIRGWIKAVLCSRKLNEKGWCAEPLMERMPARIQSNHCSQQVESNIRKLTPTGEYTIRYFVSNMGAKNKRFSKISAASSIRSSISSFLLTLTTQWQTSHDPIWLGRKQVWRFQKKEKWSYTWPVHWFLSTEIGMHN